MNTKEQEQELTKRLFKSLKGVETIFEYAKAVTFH